MQTGWVKTNNKWYYMNDDGSMKTGWILLDNYWYYLKEQGDMATGRLQTDTGVFILNAYGAMQTGWALCNSKWYYANHNGYCLKGWRYINDKWYYFDDDYSMHTGWLKKGDYWYYLDSSGAMRTGWLQLGSAKFYLDEDGAMVTGRVEIDGDSFFFDNNGYLCSNNYTYSNTQEFIQCIAPLVKKYAPQYGVKVYSPIIAQAILESASGESSLGKIYNNFFGLKCGTLWTGPSVNLRTGEEYTPGSYTTISANFRVYGSMEEGVQGYFEFLFTGRTRYNNLIGETDPYQYLVKIKADGYATSSKYVENVYRVIQSYNLTRFDD